MATVKTIVLIAIIGLSMISMAMAACDDCPQCIINKPICATFHSQYATNNRRLFSSECHMHCYNRCHNTRWNILQEVFKLCALYLITLITTSYHYLTDSGIHVKTVSDVIKRSECSLNQFLSCVNFETMRQKT